MKLVGRCWPFVLTPLIIACGAPVEERVGTAEQAVKICAAGTTLEGLDVSHYDGNIDWGQVAASGRSFAFAKATEGTSFVDSTFAANWDGMKQAGIVRSAYHFFHADMDPIAEADHFLSVMGPLEKGDLPPTLDLEVSDGESGTTIANNAIAWLDHVAQATGTKPILYTSPSFVNDTLGNPAGLDAKSQLWIANWQTNCPTIPEPFTGWPFWQYTDSGTVPGVPASVVDLNQFNGTAADLALLTYDDGASTSSSASVGATSSSAATSGAGGSSSAASTSAAAGVGGGGPAATSAGAGASTGDPDNPKGSGVEETSEDSGDAGGCAVRQGERAPAGAVGAGLLGLWLLTYRFRRSSRAQRTAGRRGASRTPA